MPVTLLNRCVIHIGGDDSASFLQGMITNDIALVTPERMLFSAMLTPQGKWQYDFFIHPHENGYLIEIDDALNASFLKTLKMYKLRAKVDITDVSDTWHIIAGWADSAAPGGAMPDPRLDTLGWRMLVPADAVPDINVTPQDYDAHRLSLAIPEGVKDATERTIAMDLGYDVLHAISFTKGCFVGQEVSARMHYKHIMRKALFQVTSAEGRILPAKGTHVMAGEIELGDMRSHHHDVGLAMLKIEAAQKAIADNTPVTAGNVNVTIRLAPWLEEKYQHIQNTNKDSVS